MAIRISALLLTPAPGFKPEPRLRWTFKCLSTPAVSDRSSDHRRSEIVPYASAAPPALIDGSEIFTPGPMVELIETLFT